MMGGCSCDAGSGSDPLPHSPSSTCANFLEPPAAMFSRSASGDSEQSAGRSLLSSALS